MGVFRCNIYLISTANKNGKLDAGDTVHVAYEFENTTKDTLTDMTLYTNIYLRQPG